MQYQCHWRTWSLTLPHCNHQIALAPNSHWQENIANTYGLPNGTKAMDPLMTTCMLKSRGRVSSQYHDNLIITEQGLVAIQTPKIKKPLLNLNLKTWSHWDHPRPKSPPEGSQPSKLMIFRLKPCNIMMRMLILQWERILRKGVLNLPLKWRISGQKTKRHNQKHNHLSSMVCLDSSLLSPCVVSTDYRTHRDS